MERSRYYKLLTMKTVDQKGVSNFLAYEVRREVILSIYINILIFSCLISFSPSRDKGRKVTNALVLIVDPL